MANQYFTCVLDAWRDGKTLYGRMHYYRSGTYTYQDSSFPDPTMNLAGTTYTDTAFGNRVRSGIDVGDVYSTTFSRTVAGTGDRTVTWTAGSGGRSDFAGTWSAVVNFPVEYTAPTGLSISNIERGIESFSATVSITGWGTNNTGDSSKYRELQVWTQGMVEPRKYKPVYGTTLSSTITCDNNATGGALTIVGNTMYTLGVYASNGNKNTGSQNKGDYTTRAYAPVLSTNKVNDTSVVMNYTLLADGGKYDKHLQYSIDNGTTWTTAATVSTGSATTGTFTISGLDDDTSYTLKCKVVTSAGDTGGTDVTFRTLKSFKLYGSVSGETKEIKKLYCSVDGNTKEVKKLYASVSGKTKQIF